MSSTSYGQPAGLFGINCGHKKYPFVDGVNFQSYFPYDKKENAERYKEFQKQREMERNIRKTKREADMLKEAGDEEGAKAARKRLAAQRKAYKEYSAEHGLKPHNDRTSVAKMAKGNDTFGDVYKDYGKTVDKVEKSDIIKAKDCKNFDELSKHFSEKYNIDIDDTVKQLDFESCRSALIGFEAINDEFPELSDFVDIISTDKSGVMNYIDRRINFNPNYFSSPDLLNKTLSENSQSGHTHKNSTAESIGVHESAHGLEHILVEKNPSYEYDFLKNFAWNDCTESKNIVKAAVKEVKKAEYGKGKKEGDMIAAISGYAKDSYSETLAEAFADVYANGENANPLSVVIKRLTKEKLNQYSGGN